MMKSINTSMEQAYRASIYLNNCAVSLQSQRCFRQALEVFQDAVQVMKRVCRATESSDLTLLQMEDLDYRLHRAMQTIANPLVEIPRESIFVFESISDDADDSYNCLESVLQACPLTGHRVFYIRIEQYEMEGLIHRDPAVDCAIVLHNYGLACLCQVDGSDSVDTQNTLIENSLRVFHLCQALLSARAIASSQGRATLQNVFFLAVTITKSLILALSKAGDQFNDEIQRCMLNLSKLKLAFLELDTFPEPRRLRSMAAAA